ncbi:MAG: phosphoenolpyruvate mutase [Deltaproteobacteria bacterium]|nr:phosphoenolpyruvate mutase [Deltaproteobacteria bacterium]
MKIQNKTLPEKRRPELKKLLDARGFIRVIEAHSGISALVGENALVEDHQGKKEFDALWISSLTDSVAKGYPDEEIVSTDSRLMTVSQISDVTSKPLLYDGDTGGFPEQLNYLIKQLEKHGVSAVVIEDKKYPKSNSLLKDAHHNMEDQAVFAQKIQYARDSQRTGELMVIARIESFIVGETLHEALSRAQTYLAAGADGIMIHSKEQSPEQVLNFAQKYNQLSFPDGRKPLMCVPTTYNTVTEETLISAGFNIVLYANQLLRASYAAMQGVCQAILKGGKAEMAEPLCSSIKEILAPVGSMRSYTAEYQNKKNKLLT